MGTSPGFCGPVKRSGLIWLYRDPPDLGGEGGVVPLPPSTPLVFACYFSLAPTSHPQPCDLNVCPTVIVLS